VAILGSHGVPTYPAQPPTWVVSSASAVGLRETSCAWLFTLFPQSIGGQSGGPELFSFLQLAHGQTLTLSFVEGP